MKFNTDKFQRQLKLEEEMQGMGVARFREEVQKARENEMETNITGVMRVMRHAFEPFVKAIDDWKDNCKKGTRIQGGGRTPHAYPYLKDIDSDVLAFLTLKTVLDNISKARTLPDVTIAIANQIVSEINFREFKKASPAHYAKVKEDVTRKTRNQSHISTVLKRSARKDNVELTQYPVPEKHKIGACLLGLMVDSTGLVELYTPPQMPNERKSPNTRVQPTAKTSEWLRESNARCELLSPVLMPMLVEPKDWKSPHSGGFWSEFIRIPLIRRASVAQLDEAENVEMWEVYQAINHMQKTRWKINKKVLEVMKSCADNKNPLGNLPAGMETPLPPVPPDIDTNTESRWLWRKKAALVYGENVRVRSKYIGLHKKLQIAERFADEEEIYFVYNLDFRGRVYPVQVHLNPQGDDVSKSLLTFAEGKPVDDETGAWLAVHGANLFGFDKVSLEDRVEWTKEHERKIVEVASDPLTYRWWTEADKPWCFLAFCFEWAEFLENPDTFKSHLPIALDGSCNGLQHFSAMLRDPIGGVATNLVPSEVPSDIYTLVATAVSKKLDIAAVAPIDPTLEKKEREKAEQDRMMARKWQGYITRAIVKRPTMTMPYGATMSGYKDQVAQILQEWKDDGKPAPDFGDEQWMGCAYLAKLIADSLAEIVVAAAAAMSWLQSVSDVVSEENLPIYWVTPVGFPVLQNYRNVLTKQVRTEIAGKFYNTAVAYGNGNKMNKRKMKAAISPNFVHSCDAAHLVRTVNLCEPNGIAALAMIHDSYGTHAADTPVLREVLRHAFVQIHETDPLLSFYEAMKRQSSNPDRIPPPPPKGGLELLKVLEADFFFA